MALDKIRLANKKARRAKKRKTIQKDLARARQHTKVQRKRARAMFIQGRKEYQTKRREDKSYIDSLEAEINAEA